MLFRSTRRGGGGRWEVGRTLGIVVPFVIAESAIGVLSLQVPTLRMPPVVGWAAVIVVLVLLSGALITWLYARRVRPPPPMDAVNPQAESGVP